MYTCNIYIHTRVIGWNVKMHSLLWVIVKKVIHVALNTSKLPYLDQLKAYKVNYICSFGECL